MKSAASTSIRAVSNGLTVQSAGWLELTNSGPCAQPFFQPEWFEAYTSAFEPAAKPYVVSVSDPSGRVNGVLPLTKSSSFFGRFPARTLRSLSNIHSCRFNLIHRESDRTEVVQQTWRSLVTDRWWDVIEVFDVPTLSAFEDLAELAKADGYLIGRWPTRRSPYVPLPSDKADPFANCPQAFKGTRHRLKAKQRKLEAELGPMELKLTTIANQAELEKFYKLEASGWKGENGSAIACDSKRVDFYTRIAQGAASRGYLSLYSLTFGTTLVAMHFGLEMSGVYYTPKVAYDERHKKHSPGLLLVHHVLVDLVRRGLQELDFLGPQMEWKRVWATHEREHANWYIFRPSVKGRLAHALTMKVAPLARRLKHRAFGDPQGPTSD